MWFETQYTAGVDLRLSFDGLGDSGNPWEPSDCSVSSLAPFNSSLPSFGSVPVSVASFKA